MATRAATLVTRDDGAVVATWADLDGTDDGSPVALGRWAGFTVYVLGTGTATIQGSNDGSHWVSLTAALASGTITPLSIVPLYIRPLAAGATNLAVTIAGSVAGGGGNGGSTSAAITSPAGAGTAAAAIRVTQASDSPEIAVLGAIGDAAWTSGNGTIDALLKAIAGAAISTNPVQTYSSDTYVHITTATTTVVKSGAGTLAKVIVNTKGTIASAITIYDNTAASGTVVGIVDSLNLSGTFVFDIAMATGITVVTTGTAAPDVTVTFR